MTLAGQTQDALALAHSLADERDEVTSYIAAGRPKCKAPSEQRSARVDRQVEELRADTDLPATLSDDLDGIAAVRRAALTGKSSALEAHQAYSAAITELHRLAEELAEQMPPRAGSGAYALAELDSAVQQAAATRGLLLAALSVPTTHRRPSSTRSPACRPPRPPPRPPTPSSAPRSAPPPSRPGCAPTPPSPTSTTPRPRPPGLATTPRSPAPRSTPPTSTSPPSPTSRRSPAANSAPAPPSSTPPSPPAST